MNIKVNVNEEIMEIPKDFTLSMLLEKVIASNWAAVFINNKQMLMKEYDTYKIKENDNIRIIRPLGGG